MTKAIEVGYGDWYIYLKFLNKKVLLITVKDSCYNGILNGIRKDKIHLTSLIICHKDGLYKAAVNKRFKNGRWFNTTSIKDIKLKD